MSQHPTNDEAGAEAAQFVPLFTEDDFVRPTGVPGPDAESHAAEVQGAETDFFLSGVEAEKKQAYTNGYDAGESETIASIGKKLDAQIAEWQARLAAVDNDAGVRLDEFFRLVEERTVEIGVAVARRILQAEVSVRPEWIAERVRGAIELYRSEAVIRVRVNDNDMVFLAKLTDNLAATEATPGSATAAQVTFIEDPSVTAGGFVVETDLARYDHTFEGQLAEMEQALAELYERTDD